MPSEDSKLDDPTMIYDDDDDDDEPEYEYEDDDDDDDDNFMEQVNVYLNAREGSPSSEDQTLEGILKKNSFRKTVKFAMDDDIFDPGSSDEAKSQQELLSKISKLTGMLREAEEQSALERDRRKKKEKSLLKLAKELKKRNAQQETDEEKMEELEEKKRYLEHHWVLAGKELDQEKILRQKLQKEHENDFERALQHEKEKYIKLRNDYEKQLESTKTAHFKQCEELGREILKANLEADRLHNQLIGAPRQTRLFSSGTSFWKGLPIRAIFFSMGVALLAFTGYTSDLFTKEAACAPVMPGMVLSRANARQSFQAPWWVPAPYKATVFEKVCGDQAQYPLTLQWLPDGQDQRLLVNQGQKTILKKNSLLKVEIYGDRVRTWNRKGLAEDHHSLWSL